MVFNICGGYQILNKNENIFNEIWKRDTADCLYDICWSEVWDSIIVVGDVKGKIHVYNVNMSPQSSPVQMLVEHQKEVASVKWNIFRENVLLSGSWDKTLKLWYDIILIENMIYLMLMIKQEY